MRLIRWVAGFGLAVSAAAYSTALARVVLGLALRTDQPYMGVWNDIAQFPLLFALVEWPITAIVLGIAVISANFLNKGRSDPKGWLLTCGLVFTLTSIGIVAANSLNPFAHGLPISVFDPYSQGWSGPEPLRKVAITIGFCIGGCTAALIYDWAVRSRRSAV